jgi:hypothetical protein
MLSRAAVFTGFYCFARAASSVSAALGVVTLLSTGCSSASSTDPRPLPPTRFVAFEPDASDASAPEDASSTVLLPAVYLGNPLCQASRSPGCYPDDVANPCELAADTVDLDGGLDAALATALACHVVGQGGGTVCWPAGYGMNSSCTKPTDCAAGHECVAGGTCRHYCCAGNISCNVGQFCDVQPTEADPNTLVPVCLPEIPCVLLDDSTCRPTQQCSIVRDNGTTSCVDLGTAGDGESCDVEHCAKGLVCVGATGARVCATLCHTPSTTATTNVRVPCGPAKPSCVGTLPLFRDPTVGVCQ